MNHLHFFYSSFQTNSISFQREDDQVIGHNAHLEHLLIHHQMENYINSDNVRT